MDWQRRIIPIIILIIFIITISSTFAVASDEYTGIPTTGLTSFNAGYGWYFSSLNTIDIDGFILDNLSTASRCVLLQGDYTSRLNSSGDGVNESLILASGNVIDDFASVSYTLVAGINYRIECDGGDFDTTFYNVSYGTATPVNTTNIAWITGSYSFGVNDSSFGNVIGISIVDEPSSWDSPDMHYSFDSADTNSTHTADTSGNGNDAFFFGNGTTTPTSTTGFVNEAFLFNNSGIDALPSINIEDTTEMTLCMWVYQDGANNGGAQLFSQDQSIRSTAPTYYPPSASKDAQWFYFDAGTDDTTDWGFCESQVNAGDCDSGADVFFDTTTAPLNDWFHVCIVYAGGAQASDADGVKMYINGSEVSFSSDDSWYDGGDLSPSYPFSTTFVTNDAPWVIGGVVTNYFYTNTTFDIWNGMIDEVDVYYDGLNAANISALYNNYLTPPCSPVWSCSSFGVCVNLVESCTAVTDANACGVPFTGDLNDYDRSCEQSIAEKVDNAINAYIALFFAMIVFGLIVAFVSKNDAMSTNPQLKRIIIGVAIFLLLIMVVITVSLL